MLDFIRKKKQSMIIKVVFATIVLSFVGTMFMVWGKGDGNGGGNGSYAARVDGKNISLAEYQHSYEEIRDLYRRLYGESLSPEMEKVLGLRTVALDALIDNLLIRNEAKRMGIAVTKDDVANAISGMKVFQKDGVFNFTIYQDILRRNRMTPEDFEASTREELTVARARDKIKEQVKVTDEEALASYRKNNDSVELEFLSFAPAELLGEVKLTEAELNDFLQKNQNEFRIPEKVSISVVTLTPASLESDIAMNDEELLAFYRKNMDRWQGKDGILPFSEVKEKVRADAIRERAAKKAYEAAVEAIRKNGASGDINAIAAELKARVQDFPLFAANVPPAALAGESGVIRKVFELKQGETGGPVETPKGIYIIKVREKKPAATPPLAEVRRGVEERARLAAASGLAQKKAKDAAAMMSSGKALKTSSTGLFRYDPKGGVPGIGVAPAIMEAAFKLTASAPVATSPFVVGDRWYAVRLKQRVEADKATFESSKEEIKKGILPAKHEEALDRWVKELRGKAKIEINQALVTDRPLGN